MSDESSTRIRIDFLRPIYDIAVWQYLVMRAPARVAGNKMPEMKYNDHRTVANIMTKLLTCKAFSHITDELTKDTYKEKTGEWTEGQQATTKLTEWCQDQWRRKNPALPSRKEKAVYGMGLPLPVTLFGEAMPVCYRCGTPCPDCRDEQGLGIPDELASAQAILDKTNTTKQKKTRPSRKRKQK